MVSTISQNPLLLDSLIKSGLLLPFCCLFSVCITTYCPLISQITAFCCVPFIFFSEMFKSLSLFCVCFASIFFVVTVGIIFSILKSYILMCVYTSLPAVIDCSLVSLSSSFSVVNVTHLQI